MSALDAAVAKLVGVFEGNARGDLLGSTQEVANAWHAEQSSVRNEVVLAGIMRKVLREGDGKEYVDFGHRFERPFITIDGRWDLTEEELLAVVGAESP